MAKRIRPLRVGRGVRWTFEVSADVDPKSDGRAPRTARKRPPVKSTVKRAKPAVRRRAQPIAKDAPVPVTSSVEPTGRVPTAQVAAAAPMMSAPPMIGPTVSAPPMIRPATSAPPTMAPTAFAPENAAPAVSPSASGASQTTRLQWAVLVAAAVLVVAAVAYPRGPAAPEVPAADGSAAAALPAGRSAQAAQAIATDAVPATAASTMPAAAAIVAPVNEAPKKVLAPAVTKRAAGAKSSSPVVAAPVEQPKKEEPVAVVASVERPPAPVSASTAIVTSGLVTITGCLEISTDGDTFRLTDAEGADVPKARSWRSGFFKKRPAPVMLVDPPEHLGLKTSVGKRVSATGQLANRDLRISSLHVVGPSCN